MYQPLYSKEKDGSVTNGSYGIKISINFGMTQSLPKFFNKLLRSMKDLFNVKYKWRF